jgi:crotonobetainyl-CoA:carnitine CoA-transferase CaiB-like acyl-CoA transferase
MEQAVALPFATRHLADLGAEVIRVQSHKRGIAGLTEIDLTRNKKQLAIDLATPGGPEAFLRIAATCDIVAHNYTPRVVRQFGIDYERVRAIRPDVIYVSLTGFGTTGPWGERPLFGPGAEAVSGHNLLIGDPDGWPGRPGTIVFADSNCGLHAVFAILAALDERDRTGEGQHIDVSLYETAVSHLGPVLAERQLGAEPRRFGNVDASFAIHGVFACAGHDRHLALAAHEHQLDALAGALGLSEATPEAVATALRTRDASEAAALLQSHGIAASLVSDASDIASDEHLWQRDYFGIVERALPGIEGRYPHEGPAWGHGPGVPLEESRPVGADTAAILRELGGYTPNEIDALFERGVVGSVPGSAGAPHPADHQVRVDRGELSRIDGTHDGWRARARDRR